MTAILSGHLFVVLTGPSARQRRHGDPEAVSSAIARDRRGARLVGVREQRREAGPISSSIDLAREARADGGFSAAAWFRGQHEPLGRGP